MNWFRPRLRILFVCTANVCRSPLAEGLLRHRLREGGTAGRVQVRSAGTSVGQRGRRTDPRVAKLAEESGVSLARIRARMLTVKMIRRSDYVLVMERRHLDDIGRLCAVPGSSSAEARCPENVRLLGSFLPHQDGSVPEIPDPYFGDWQSICDTYSMIDSALTGFLAHLDLSAGNFRDS